VEFEQKLSGMTIIAGEATKDEERDLGDCLFVSSNKDFCYLIQGFKSKETTKVKNLKIPIG
jgi:hypothetical protein